MCSSDLDQFSQVPTPVPEEYRAPMVVRNIVGFFIAEPMSMPDALRHLADRVPLLDARFFVTAVLTQRESGGNLAEILDNLGDVIRQRFRVRRQIRVVTAHARLTGWVLTFIPVVIGLAMAVVAPDNILVLIQDPLGIRLMLAAFVLWLLGYFAIRRLTDVEY